MPQDDEVRHQGVVTRMQAEAFETEYGERGLDSEHRQRWQGLHHDEAELWARSSWTICLREVRILSTCGIRDAYV